MPEGSAVEGTPGEAPGQAPGSWEGEPQADPVAASHPQVTGPMKTAPTSMVRKTVPRVA